MQYRFGSIPPLDAPGFDAREDLEKIILIIRAIEKIFLALPPAVKEQDYKP